MPKTAGLVLKWRLKMPKSTERKEFEKLVKRLGGWMEGDIARFPTVDAKDRFKRALAKTE